MNAPTVTIDQPGVYDLTAEQYHRDPVPGGSLSHSGAKLLLPPNCPALFHHWATHGRPPKAEYDFGHAAHAEILGVGAPIKVINAKDWRTKAAQEEKKAAYAVGETPLLRHEYEQVQEMAAALREHPVASALLDPASGRPEQALFWVDQETGVWRRAMVDWLRHDTGGPFYTPDYKSTTSVEPGHLSKALYEYGYAQQAAWYLDGIEALGLSSNWAPTFLLIFQQKTRPYLVTVAQPDPEAIQWGRVLNRKAIDEYCHCKATGHWPTYSDGKVIPLSFPAWVERRLEAAWERGDLDITTPQGVFA